MKIFRKIHIGLLILVWLAGSAVAQEYEEGVHYRRLATPVPTTTEDKIEVVEIFWYGCPHCYNLEPTIEAWLEDKPENVAFVHMPAVLGRGWEAHARAYYTAEVLGVLDKIHMPLFNAIHREGRRLANEQQLAEFFAEQGVDKEAFHKAYNSFDVETRLRRAQQRVRQYGIHGVPAMVVNGKYVTTGRMAGTMEDIMAVVTYLVQKESEGA